MESKVWIATNITEQFISVTVIPVITQTRSDQIIGILTCRVKMKFNTLRVQTKCTVLDSAPNKQLIK